MPELGGYRVPYPFASDLDYIRQGGIVGAASPSPLAREIIQPSKETGIPLQASGQTQITMSGIEMETAVGDQLLAKAMAGKPPLTRREGVLRGVMGIAGQLLKMDAAKNKAAFGSRLAQTITDPELAALARELGGIDPKYALSLAVSGVDARRKAALQKERDERLFGQKKELQQLEAKPVERFVPYTLPSGVKAQRSTQTGKIIDLPGGGGAGLGAGFEKYLRLLPDYSPGFPPTRAQIAAANKLQQIDVIAKFEAQGFAMAGRPKSPEVAGKAQMIEGAIDAIVELKGMLFAGGDAKRGAINPGLLKTMNISIPFVGGGLPFTQGREARSLLREALNAKLRAETGAQANPQELDELEKIYSPSMLDTDAAIRSKIRRLEQFMRLTNFKIDPRKGVVDSIREQVDAPSPPPRFLPDSDEDIFVGTKNGLPVYQRPDGSKYMKGP